MVVTQKTQTGYSYDAVVRGVLDELSDGNSHHIASTIERLADRLTLTPEDRAEMMAAGLPRFNYIVYRLHRFLSRIDFIRQTASGMYQMTMAGQAFLTSNPDVTLTSLRRFYKQATFSADSEATQPYEAIPPLRTRVKQALRSINPDLFEQLVIDLLRQMNYQGSFEGIARETLTPDYRISGIIREDRLGLKDIIQVKAHRPEDDRSIDRPMLESFVTDMQQTGAQKGIVLSTAGITGSARKYAEQAPGGVQIALIDGEFLIQLMIEYRVGIVEIEQITRQIDPEYFPEADL